MSEAADAETRWFDQKGLPVANLLSALHANQSAVAKLRERISARLVVMASSPQKEVAVRDFRAFIEAIEKFNAEVRRAEVCAQPFALWPSLSQRLFDLHTLACRVSGVGRA